MGLGRLFVLAEPLPTTITSLPSCLTVNTTAAWAAIEGQKITPSPTIASWRKKRAGGKGAFFGIPSMQEILRTRAFDNHS